jgi:hypothetical protein
VILAQEIENYKMYYFAIENKNIFSLGDIIVTPIILLLVYFFLKYKKRKQPKELQSLFLKGYFIRVIGLLGFILFHKFVYKTQVDSFSYYWAGNNLCKFFYLEPLRALDLIFSFAGKYVEGDFQIPLAYNIFSFNESLVAKISGLLSILCFESYISMCLVLNLFCFGGCWKMFKLYYKLYPDDKTHLALCFLFIPSLFFWTAGLSKEIICIGALGFLLNSSVLALIYKENKLLNWGIVILMSYVIYQTKIYILIAFIPAMMILILILMFKKLKQRLLKLLFGPILITVFLTSIYYVYTQTDIIGNRFSSDEIVDYAKVSYDYLSKSGLAESAYDLGKFEPSIGGILKLAPSGIIVTLFRPYFWESKKLVTLLASVESTIYLLLTLYVLFKTGIRRSIKLIFKNPYILFSLLFAIIFSLAVGLTSGNFGTLMRYKIPMMPFYSVALVLIYKRREVSAKIIS